MSTTTRPLFRIISGTIGWGSLTVILLFATRSRWSALQGEAPLPEQYRAELSTLGGSALASRDIPVAALLIHGGRIIGRGFNTVRRNGHAGEHAEINAISDAMDSLGYDRFMALDRDSLELISTLEPCPMCAGAILEYRIRHVSILKGKPFTADLLQDLRLLPYAARLRSIGSERLQDSLLRLHPDFHPGRE